MADYDDTEPDVNPAFPQDNRLDPALDQVRGMFTTPDGAELASTVLPIIQQHLNAVRVADTNAAAGQQVVTDLDQTKRNLVDMVKQDPTAAELGVALAPHLVADIVRGSGLDPDQQEAVHSDLTSHIQSEIARAAVTRMAELHANSATTLMDMLSDHLSDTDKTHLSGYINTMEAARVLDHGAHTDQLMDDAARISRNKAFGYAQQLLDPRTESVQFPPTFMANLVAERGIAPADKAPLYTAFDNLRRFGDVPNSDPYVLSDIVKAIADPEVNVPADAIMRHVGTSLRYADAQVLHGLSTTRIAGWRRPPTARATRRSAVLSTGSRHPIVGREPVASTRPARVTCSRASASPILRRATTMWYRRRWRVLNGHRSMTFSAGATTVRASSYSAALPAAASPRTRQPTRRRRCRGPVRRPCR